MTTATHPSGSPALSYVGVPGRVDPPPAEAQELYFLLVADLLPREDRSEEGEERLEGICPDDVDDGTADDLIWCPAQPLGVPCTHPLVAEIPSAAGHRRRHGVGNQAQLIAEPVVPFLAVAQRLLVAAALDEVGGLANVKRQTLDVEFVRPTRRPEVRRNHAQRVAVTPDQGGGQHRTVAGLPCHRAHGSERLVGLHVVDHYGSARAEGTTTGGIIVDGDFTEVVEEGSLESVMGHDPQHPAFK